MKSTAIACAIAASALGFSSLSFAQGSGWDRDQRSERREDRHGYQNTGVLREPVQSDKVLLYVEIEFLARVLLSEASGRVGFAVDGMKGA